ncbi:MAG TPA: tetratricopeptide repeat protein [Vicinamibacterales bacterium]|nr:tetratricopeptide repeat protein [Vicinamibacterales bacterium]
MWRFVPVLLVLAAFPAAAAAAGGQASPAKASAGSAKQPAAPAGDGAAYHFLLARQLEKAGDTEEAIAALNRAAELAPRSAEIRAELAGLYAREDRIVDALNAGEDALKLDPGNVEANRLLGLIFASLVEQKRPVRPGDDPAAYQARAIAALEKGRGFPGADLNTEFTLGRLYLRAGRHHEAIGPLLQVFEQQPQYSEGGMLLAAAQEGAGQIDEATQTVEAVLAHSPTFFRGYVRLIELYERQRRWKDAAEAYAVAQELNPRADLLAGRAMALINSGAAAEARRLLDAALRTETTPNPSHLYLLAESQRRLKDHAAALATSQRLRASFPDRAVFVYQHAQLLEEAGRFAEAERELRALLARDPLDAIALNSLGYMYAERGERLDEAVELLQRALKVEPGNPSYLDSLGWAFFKQGRLELADPPLTEAAEKMPENSVIQDHLGDLRIRQQRLPEAIAAWERALAGDGESIDRAAIEKKLRDARARVGRN